MSRTRRRAAKTARRVRETCRRTSCHGHDNVQGSRADSGTGEERRKHENVQPKVTAFRCKAGSRKNLLETRIEGEPYWSYWGRRKGRNVRALAIRINGKGSCGREADGLSRTRTHAEVGLSTATMGRAVLLESEVVC